MWSIMLQSVLIGKASEAFSTLSVDNSSDYDKVKAAILKAYELVPEAYRQKFRNTRKANEQTHVEFAREQEQLFDRWVNSKEVDKDFTKLRELMLIEQFKNCIQSEIKTYLDEHKVETLAQAATRSDDYALTHKTSFTKGNYFKGKYNSGSDSKSSYSL